MRLGSWVIARAADAIVDKGRRIAGAMLEAAEEDIEFAQQRFVIKGTDRGIGLFEIAAAARGDGIPSDLRGPLMGISDETMSIPSYAYTCAVCEVEVDPETGFVEVVRYTSIDMARAMAASRKGSARRCGRRASTTPDPASSYPARS